MSDNIRTCQTPYVQPIVFNTIAYQNSANTVYQSTTFSIAAGQPKQFKSDYERMQYLLGRQNQASCGVPKVTRATW